LNVRWNLRDVLGRTWKDGDVNRLRAYVELINATSGIQLGYVPSPYRSEEPGYGYPVPRDFRP
jgi:hypothetical protein